MKKIKIGVVILLWVLLLTVEAVVMATVGENKGTRDSFMWIPVLITMFSGLIGLIGFILWTLKKKKK